MPRHEARFSVDDVDGVDTVDRANDWAMSTRAAGLHALLCLAVMLTRRSPLILIGALVSVLVPLPARGQVPPGHSARLIGVHDVDGSAVDFLRRSSEGCDHGWLTHAHAVGHSGEGGEFDASGLRRDGISVIVRLDDTWERTVPTDAGERAGYADAFAGYVSRSTEVHVWIVGNEPNVSLGGTPDRYVVPYAAAYAAVRDRVHALPGHGRDVVLLSAPSPWSPCFLDGFAQSIEGVESLGVAVDGFAIHAYTGHTATTQDPARITSDERRSVCPGGRYDETYGEFRVYRSFIEVIEDAGHGGDPVYVTEAGHACEGTSRCYADEDRGYFAAMYREVDAWNRAASTVIRAVTPYRWLALGDGTPRDFAIGDKPRLQADLAAGAVYTWTEPDCDEPPPPGCGDDGDCDDGTICDLGAAECTSVPACGAVGECEPGWLCRMDRFDCVPALRGAARIDFRPTDPGPGDDVALDASSSEGYTNVGIVWEGPLGTAGRPPVGDIEVERRDDGRIHWEWPSSVAGEGTYRATFTADPAGTTVYAIAYLDVGTVEPPPDADADVDTDTDVDSDVDTDADTDADSDGDADSTGDADLDDGPEDDASTTNPGDLGGGCACRAGAGRPEWLSTLRQLLLTLI
jgi:hypothetical protein